MHSLVFEQDATDRENMLIEAETLLSVYLPGVDVATEKALRRQLDALKGGGR